MAGPEEGGTYTCHVSNRVGQRNATVTVDVVGKVHGWTLVLVYVCVCACVHAGQRSEHVCTHAYKST